MRTRKGYKTDRMQLIKQYLEFYYGQEIFKRSDRMLE